MEMGAKKSRSSDTATAGRRSSTSNSSGASAVARKEIERRRRQHMKSLCVKLASLIPREHFPRVSVCGDFVLTLNFSIHRCFTTFILKCNE